MQRGTLISSFSSSSFSSSSFSSLLFSSWSRKMHKFIFHFIIFFLIIFLSQQETDAKNYTSKWVYHFHLIKNQNLNFSLRVTDFRLFCIHCFSIILEWTGILFSWKISRIKLRNCKLNLSTYYLLRNISPFI